MKIEREIVLENPERCDGCPFIITSEDRLFEGGGYSEDCCVLEYWDWWNNPRKEEALPAPTGECAGIIIKYRPEQCITENGK